MQAFDLSPLFRSTVGYDRLAHMAEAARRGHDGTATYPPYNIEKRGDDGYAITLAVAGFAPDDLSVEVEDAVLTVRGRKARQDAGDGAEADYLHRGIALRDFVRRYQLADHVRVDGADLDNGLLTVRLHREVPEAAKPRRIPVSRAA